ncbi:hypothetical protein P4S73_04740 [Paraglaciecola sp. Hal342]
MNQAEYAALDSPELSAEAVTLYVTGFRQHMDYASGRVLVSLAAMRRKLEFIPPVGSTAKPVRPTVQKVRSVIDMLVRHQLIRCVEKGDKQSRKPAVFLCVLATSDLVRLNEEQHENNTRTTRAQKPLNVFDLKACRQKSKKIAFSEEQHSSVNSEQDNIYNACVREDLVFNDQFRLTAKQAMLIIDDQDLLDVFEQFKVSPKDDGAAKNQGQWLKLWRSYCVNVRINNKKRGGYNAINQQFGNGAGEQNAAARALAESKRAAEHCAEEGIDGSILDQIIELAEGQA